MADPTAAPSYGVHGITPISHPAVRAIPVEEVGEPLVDVRATCPAVLVRAPGEGGLVRAGVADRLADAAARLPATVRLLLVEGYRTTAAQAAYFDAHAASLRAANPSWDAQRTIDTAALHVAPPDVGPHCAGAAVDLTLCTPDGVERDLGTAIDATPEASGGRCFLRHPEVVGPARRDRDLLAAVMAAAGFVNYGPEWWHWSYGDRFWALQTGAPAAVYAHVDGVQAR